MKPVCFSYKITYFDKTVVEVNGYDIEHVIQTCKNLIPNTTGIYTIDLIGPVNNKKWLIF